jgi:hypothetical protein
MPEFLDIVSIHEILRYFRVQAGQSSLMLPETGDFLAGRLGFSA